MGVIKRVAKSRSKTIAWGHVQVFIGGVGAALGFINPAMFPDLPAWAYGLAAMGAGVITYALRSITRTPLE